MAKIPFPLTGEIIDERTIEAVNSAFERGELPEVREVQLEQSVDNKGNIILMLNIPDEVDYSSNLILIGMIIGRTYSIIND